MSEIKGWVRVEDAIPEIGDYSVVAFFRHGGMDMVHVHDYFKDITAGFDAEGNQLYKKWYKIAGVTHWHPMPPIPQEAI